MLDSLQILALIAISVTISTAAAIFAIWALIPDVARRAARPICSGSLAVVIFTALIILLVKASD